MIINMESFKITPTYAANLNAFYLRTAVDGQKHINANTLVCDGIIQQIREDMLAEHEGEYNPTHAVKLVHEASILEGQNIELGYRVENADAKARILYEHHEGNIALREAAFAEAALAGVHVNV